MLYLSMAPYLSFYKALIPFRMHRATWFFFFSVLKDNTQGDHSNIQKQYIRNHYLATHVELNRKLLFCCIMLLHFCSLVYPTMTFKNQPKQIHPFKAGHQDYLHNSFLQIIVASHFLETFQLRGRPFANTFILTQNNYKMQCFVIHLSFYSPCINVAIPNGHIAKMWSITTLPKSSSKTETLKRLSLS